MKSLSPFRLFRKATGMQGSLPGSALPGALPSAPTDSLAQVFPSAAPPLRVASAIHPVAQATISGWRGRRRTETAAPRLQSTLLRTAGWVSAGVGAVALGLVVGRELRQRYVFNRRTPYDFYAHSGDSRELDFGVGV